MIALGAFITYLLVCGIILILFVALGRLLSWTIWKLAHYRQRIHRRPLSERRSATLRVLIRSLIDVLAVALTLVFLLGQVITPATLATTFGLFSAGLGIAARPFISDVMSGILLIFKDEFAIGEKVEIGDRTVTGVVESVSLTTTTLRGDSGELWIVPNGDVRTIRNFSRSSFSPAHIRLTIPTSQLHEGLAALQAIAADPGPDVVEPPQIISEEGKIGETTSLMLKVKVRTGHAPQVRRTLLQRLHATLAERQVANETQIVDEKDHADGRDKKVEADVL